MDETSTPTLHKVLAFTSIAEIATGLALIFDPRFVVWLLVGSNAPMGRLPGIAILALGSGAGRAQTARWPTQLRCEACWSTTR